MRRQCRGRLLIDVRILKLMRHQQIHEDGRRAEDAGHGHAPRDSSDAGPFRLLRAGTLEIGDGRQAAGHEGEKNEQVSDDAQHRRFQRLSFSMRVRHSNPLGLKRAGNVGFRRRPRDGPQIHFVLAPVARAGIGPVAANGCREIPPRRRGGLHPDVSGM